MPGLPDYSAQNVGNYIIGLKNMPTLPSVFLALFTASPTSDAGTGGTEVSGGAYARVQVAGSVTTNATTTTASAVLNFASVPAWITAGMTAWDNTTPSAITGGQTVLSKTGTTVTLSGNVNATVGGTDSIAFSAFPAMSASSGSEPSVTPANTVNGAVVSFLQASASWGTVLSWGLYDAVTSGNVLFLDFLGNNKWLPFSCTSASPGVFTSPAHGYANGNFVEVTTKFGGTLPTTAGSFAGALTVAGATTDTFNVGVNTTSTGDGMVRAITQQSIPQNVTASFNASTFTLQFS